MGTAVVDAGDREPVVVQTGAGPQPRSPRSAAVNSSSQAG